VCAIIVGFVIRVFPRFQKLGELPAELEQLGVLVGRGGGECGD
jgi:hypothetical protein